MPLARAQNPGPFNYSIEVFSEWRGKAFYLNVRTALEAAGPKMRRIPLLIGEVDVEVVDDRAVADVTRYRNAAGVREHVAIERACMTACPLLESTGRAPRSAGAVLGVPDAQRHLDEAKDFDGGGMPMLEVYP